MRRVPYLLVVVTLALGLMAPPAAARSEVFHAVLTGANEVPPRETPALGVALLASNHDETRLRFIVLVARIKNVFAAHIHCGEPGVNGPVGVTLFMDDPGGGRVFGVLAAGRVTAPDPGNECDWVDVGDVIAAIEAGNAYVNVHTNDGVDPPDTGPGDFPGGEIRGQIS
jgi:CHRD domain